MEDTIIKFEREIKFRHPVLIEGLPGVGNVGKIAAEHLIDTLGAERFATIYSKHLPPQVIVGNGGLIKLVNHELYYHRRERGDLIILSGDYQAISHEGQYIMAQKMIELAKRFGVKKIFTLGGYGMGQFVEKPRVFGAVNMPELIDELEHYGVIFKEGEPGSGIIGASGLLIGLGALHSIPGVCLMGETYGYIADPNGARAVLRVLMRALDLNIDLSDLEKRAIQVERITMHIKDINEMLERVNKEDTGYIR